MPSFAYSRKQIRQSPKSRIKARLRPQRKQRRTMRELNLGFLSARALVEVFAMSIFNVAKRSIKIATPSLEIAYLYELVGLGRIWKMAVCLTKTYSVISSEGVAHQ